MLAPVVVFVYNRPNHTQETLEALKCNKLASETDMYIFSDNARNEKDASKVNAVRAYIRDFANRAIFHSVKIIEAEKNNGLANSVISGVTQIIKTYGKVIVVEDDLVTSTDFLVYMNSSLDYYQLDNTIWSISGYTFSMKSLEDYKNDVYLSYRACSWGWATWEDRWIKTDWDVSDYNKFIYNYKCRKAFNLGGSDLAGMLDIQMESRIDSWAIRWCYAQFKCGKFTVYPKESKVINIGT
ncbi:sugar transferase, partial [Bacillaceae bacterium Marseille-Q3522]|nr:sugar transferase [Bacillaceae bacterium Marseille-Q3522]